MLGTMDYTKEYSQSNNNTKLVQRARIAQITCASVHFYVGYFLSFHIVSFPWFYFQVH